jgi:hypothetical protein
MFKVKTARIRQVPFPIPIFQCNFLPGNIVGLSLGIAIALDERFYEDSPTITHELVHCRQFWRNGLVLHFLRYWLCKSYRQAMELEAFLAELSIDPDIDASYRLQVAANALASAYGLKLTVQEASNLLKAT